MNESSSRNSISLSSSASNNGRRRSSGSMKKRRDSKILLEGVEYDLSNLLTKELLEAAENDSDDSEEETSGYLPCSNNKRNNSRPSLPRPRGKTKSAEAALFEKQKRAKRRQSPYRFDLEAMRFLMAGMNGIPELSNSFRLSKSGCVVEADEPTTSCSGSGREREEEHLLGCRSEDSEEEEEDLLPPSPYDNFKEEVPGRVSVSSTNTTDTESPYPSFHDDTRNNNTSHNVEEEDNALDDLVFDHATGTYVYREAPAMADSTRYYDTDPALDMTEYHDVPVEGSRYTLEEMVECAQIDDCAQAFDDDEHEMEISPGVYVPFRGAKETWQAVASHQTLELHCLDCDAHLVCINDCEYSVCPDCRVVNPVFGGDSSTKKPVGVGMGFKKEWVVKKQMLQAEKERRNSDMQSLKNQGSKHAMGKEGSKHRMQQQQTPPEKQEKEMNQGSSSSRHKMMQQQERQASHRRRSAHGLSKR